MTYNDYIQWTTAGEGSNALRYAADVVKTLDNTTNNAPTLDTTNEFWADAYSLIQRKFGALGWTTPVTATADSDAEQSLQEVEACITSMKLLQNVVFPNDAAIARIKYLKECAAEFFEDMKDLDSSAASDLGFTSSVRSSLARSFETDSNTKDLNRIVIRDAGVSGRTDREDNRF